ncbi:MAG: 3-phosphoshikimate 1-carboxyvinyltransferase [Alphaproteobacteria bacterium]|nr:3-phosphoshikimate 1-carboxyvinyltransferase [Alphaproteobacteria bacterium]
MEPPAQHAGLSALPCRELRGEIRPPGDKSISHRAIMLGMLSIGTTEIHGLLEGEDVLATINACRALGADIEQIGAQWFVTGVGIGGLRPPENVLNMGNSGTACRLMTGILASHPLQCFLNGDASLRARPMQRVTIPLSKMGARFETTQGRLPLMILGAHQPIPITYSLPVVSAQVKSAVLFSGLNCPGTTSVIESIPTRNHTERMLPLFGAEISVQQDQAGASLIALRGHQELHAAQLNVPADISSAAFALVAAAVVPGSEITLHHVMNNQTRNGIVQTLIEMGANITTTPRENMCGENTVDIVIAQAPLTGIRVPAERVPSMVDEFPILAVAAACAAGVTRFENISELCVKESDRLSETANMLLTAGVEVATGDDWMEITGRAEIPGGGVISTGGDHRIAMSTLILGCICAKGMSITDRSAILTSYPNFIPQMQDLGCILKSS